MHRESAFGIVDQPEVLACLLDADHVHEAGRICLVGADLVIDLDVPLHEDGGGFSAIERILQPIPDEDDERQTVTELVGTG